MFDLIIQNPLLSIICVAILVGVGKYLFMSKDDERNLKQDINNLGQKSDDKDAEIEKRLMDKLHETEIKIAEKFGEHSEKMRVIQKETLQEMDKKFLTKELGFQHENRIAKLEQMMVEIAPRLAKIDTMFELLNKNNK